MKVLVACNHTLIGQSIVSMLPRLPRNGAMTEGRLCTLAQAVDVYCSWRPNVILVEAVADFPGALSTIRALLKADFEARAVVLGSETDDAALYEAVSAGAVGFLAHDASAATVGATLSGVANGELGLSRTASLHMLQLLRQSQQTHIELVGSLANDKFTQREREVFELVRRGMRSREIGNRLSIAEATVYKHIQNILDKLQVRSRTEAVYVFERMAPEQLTPPPSQ
jgi:DNA-binding NarL/FixJ family response regulator